jgi:hypothetical protein
MMSLCSALTLACGAPGETPLDAGSAPRDATGDHSRIDAPVDATADHRSKDAAPDHVYRDAQPDARLDGGDDGTPGDGGVLPFFDAGTCGVGSQGEPTDLSCTGLYSNFATKTVASNVRPYTPGLALWSDGAQKSRWIYLPPGTTIGTSDMDEWTFPVGTKLWKEFRLTVGASTTPTRIETRLIWKTATSTWYRTTYRWSSDGETSATELTLGQEDANGEGYEIPNQGMCNTCHDGRIDGVLGFEAVSLGSSAAQGFAMPELLEAGVLSNAPSSPLTIPGDPTAAAALGWLHVNCGESCHNGGQGEAKSTGFRTRLDVATLDRVDATDTYTTGWNLLDRDYEIPGTAVTYRLHACSPGTSAAYYRAAHRDHVDGAPEGTQMPPIDTHRVDDAGLSLLAAWIDEACDAGASDAQ